MALKNPFSNFIDKILSFFTSGKAQKDVTIALNYLVEALPYIEMAAEIAATVAPSGVPLAVLQTVKAKYPHLFDGTILTSDELKSYLLGIASSMLATKFPALNDTTATLAVQMAYTQAKAIGKAPKLPAPPNPDGVLLKVKAPRKSFLEI